MLLLRVYLSVVAKPKENNSGHGIVVSQSAYSAADSSIRLSLAQCSRVRLVTHLPISLSAYQPACLPVRLVALFRFLFRHFRSG